MNDIWKFHGQPVVGHVGYMKRRRGLYLMSPYITHLVGDFAAFDCSAMALTDFLESYFVILLTHRTISTILTICDAFEGFSCFWRRTWSFQEASCLILSCVFLFCVSFKNRQVNTHSISEREIIETSLLSWTTVKTPTSSRII